MWRFSAISKRSLCLVVVLVFCLNGAIARQTTGTLSGRISDQQGGVIIAASLTIIDAKGVERVTTTNEQGGFSIDGLAPGKYTVRVAVEGFASYENAEVEISPGRREPLNIQLSVAMVKSEVTISEDRPVLSTSPDKTANTIVLKGQDVESLPDDPDDLANALQSMAGQSAGPNGGQLYVDGFASSQLPAKISIREIRINQNPIAAENDSPGIGRIDIFTQPGTEKLHGSGFFSLIDGHLNSRNPFSTNKLPFQRRQFGGTVSGSLVPKKLSFSADFQRQDQGESQLISATVLDGPGLDIVPVRLSVLTPRVITGFSTRFDYQLSGNHTLMARYSFADTTNENQGVGGFNLPSRGFSLSNSEHLVRVTETSVLSPSMINETRFQYVRNLTNFRDDNSQPAIDVLQGFSGGGSQIGRSTHQVNRWDLENYTSRAFHGHTLKFGGRLRGVWIDDISENNFGGTFVYAGGLAPALDADNQVIPGRFEAITSIERYRRTQLFLREGLTIGETRLRGGGASQFSINTGNPLATASRIDYGGFIQDDWLIRSNFTLSLGLRYENQSNIDSNLNLAPRLTFAWAPNRRNSSRPAQMVVRGGFGIFYERFSEISTLQTHRFNGSNQLQLVVRDPDFLTVPSGESLPPNSQPTQIVRRVAEDFQAPYSLFSVIGIERQLPLRITVSALYFNVRTKHALRQRNINAPLPGAFVPENPGGGERPFGDVGEIFLYESSGNQNENRLQIIVNGRISAVATFFVNYNLSKAEGDAEGNFPASSYDLESEYGSLSTDVRHRFVVGGNFSIPRLKVALNSLVIARSGFPFNITTGRDTNGDSLFTERPAFARDLTRPSVVDTRYGSLDLTPLPGAQIIPRNFGRGPAFFSVALGLSRVFGFDSFIRRASADTQKSSNAQAKGPASLIPGSGKRSSREARYRVVASLNCENLFNRANGGIPVGNLSSTLFDQSISSAGPYGGGVLQSANRRLRFQVRFEF